MQDRLYTCHSVMVHHRSPGMALNPIFVMLLFVQS
jgi:hypothetical protein